MLNATANRLPLTISDVLAYLGREDSRGLVWSYDDYGNISKVIEEETGEVVFPVLASGAEGSGSDPDAGEAARGNSDPGLPDPGGGATGGAVHDPGLGPDPGGGKQQLIQERRRNNATI